MLIKESPIAGVAIVETGCFEDQRGCFSRLFDGDSLAPILGGRRIMQVNLSRTDHVGALRGLHFQRAPSAEIKLIRCLRGRVFDVAVDIRAGSPTFLQWFGIELSPDDSRMLVVPEGFAHGFQTLEPRSELLYLHTAAYAARAEDGIAVGDPRLAIAWPLPVDSATMSERDRGFAPLSQAFSGLTL